MNVSGEVCECDGGGNETNMTNGTISMMKQHTDRFNIPELLKRLKLCANDDT